MNRKLKTVLCAALVLLMMFSCCCVSFADEPMPVTVKAKAAVLMDVDSGKVLMSMNADEKLYPASVTKIMTLLLVTEALDSGKISLSDTVPPTPPTPPPPLPHQKAARRYGSKRASR